MSRKSHRRRRKKRISSAAVNVQLMALTDCVAGLGSSTDLSCVASCTARILYLATAEGVHYFYCILSSNVLLLFQDPRGGH